jgi:hypothetical protein
MMWTFTFFSDVSVFTFISLRSTVFISFNFSIGEYQQRSSLISLSYYMYLWRLPTPLVPSEFQHGTQYAVLQHRCTLCTVPVYKPLCIQ